MDQCLSIPNKNVKSELMPDYANCIKGHMWFNLSEEQD